MTNEQTTVMKLLVMVDQEKMDIDKKIDNHKGTDSDMISLMVIKGGIIGKLKTLSDITKIVANQK